MRVLSHQFLHAVGWRLLLGLLTPWQFCHALCMGGVWTLLPWKSQAVIGAYTRKRLGTGVMSAKPYGWGPDSICLNPHFYVMKFRWHWAKQSSLDTGTVSYLLAIVVSSRLWPKLDQLQPSLELLLSLSGRKCSLLRSWGLFTTKLE